MEYYVNDEKVTKEQFFEQLENAVYDYTSEHYDEIIDECYPEVKIGVLTFSPSMILYKCDPVAYRCGISDESSFRLDELQRIFKYEHSESVNGIDFETVDNE